MSIRMCALYGIVLLLCRCVRKCVLRALAHAAAPRRRPVSA
jgi:hypothetical protein